MIFFNEKRIIEACLSGCRRSQERLYNRFSEKMFNVCLGYSQDFDSAQDLLQEGFIKVFQNLHKYKREGSLEGWIRRTIINKAIDEYRSNVKDRELTEFTEDIVINHNSFVDNLASNNMDVDDFLQMIHSLPKGYRIILNLHFVEDYTHKEIAKKLGITEGTSKSQLAKAKKYIEKERYQIFDKEQLKEYERRTLKKVV